MSINGETYVDAPGERPQRDAEVHRKNGRTGNGHRAGARTHDHRYDDQATCASTTLVRARLGATYASPGLYLGTVARRGRHTRRRRQIRGANMAERLGVHAALRRRLALHRVEHRRRRAALERHNAGTASRYTASRRPVELALALAMADRGAAMREEARIKRLDRAGEARADRRASPAPAASPRRSAGSRGGVDGGRRGFGHDGGMATPTIRRAASRSQRTSGAAGPSTRPRRDGAPPRPADLDRPLPACSRRPTGCATRRAACSSSPPPSAAERDRFLDRLIEDRACLLSLDKVRGLLGGAVAEEEIPARAEELLRSGRRSSAWRTARRWCSPRRPPAWPSARDFVRAAAALKRPRHLILLEIARDQVQEEDLAELNELRRRLDAGELGGEGFQTVLRLGGGTAEEVKRIPSGRRRAKTLAQASGHRRFVLRLRPPPRAGPRRRGLRTVRDRGRSRGSRRRASRPGARRPWRVPK